MHEITKHLGNFNWSRSKETPAPSVNKFSRSWILQPNPTIPLPRQLRKDNLPYLHVTESHVGGNLDVDAPPQRSNNFLRRIWCKEGNNGVQCRNMVIFGRLYIPKVDSLALHLYYYLIFTPLRHLDLPNQLMYDLPFAKPNLATFHLFDDLTGKGCITIFQQQTHKNKGAKMLSHGAATVRMYGACVSARATGIFKWEHYDISTSVNAVRPMPTCQPTYVVDSSLYYQEHDATDVRADINKQLDEWIDEHYFSTGTLSDNPIVLQ
ncbi:hypothetical protein DFH29DRAFT_1069429 [Suillus ampliporus]|nr:hypothetical protein DFH29DRAFT_1069429 [Suillus ampliporus]